MKWAVLYRVTSDDMPWRDLPTEGVLWVDVEQGGYHHRLSGHDNYWIHGDSFGVWNDQQNWAWYGGGPEAQYHAWQWVRGGSRSVVPPIVPDSAHVIRGVLVPDEFAREIGLLGAGESLPARVR